MSTESGSIAAARGVKSTSPSTVPAPGSMRTALDCAKRVTNAAPPASTTAWGVET
jgi:hypothetical protein